MRIVRQGFDHVEFVAKDDLAYSQSLLNSGFECVGEKNDSTKGLRSKVYQQGFARIVLTTPLKIHGKPSSGVQCHELDFLKAHGDGICAVGLAVENAEEAYLETTRRGARSAMEPMSMVSKNGSTKVQFARAEIFTPTDLRYVFVQRDADSLMFDFECEVKRLESPDPFKIRLIDHLTNNVGMGETKVWRDYYTDIFRFNVTKHFDIRTGRTGLFSDVIESPDRKIKVPINEATEKESQVQEFYDRFNGVGVQHLAFYSTDILQTVSHLSKSNIFAFLKVPSSYYEAVPSRVQGYTEDLGSLEQLGILIDGDETGYLLQIFTNEVVGPFFFEFIQRKGNQGFGYGNFKALFEAIERNQIQRGVLK